MSVHENAYFCGRDVEKYRFCPEKADLVVQAQFKRSDGASAPRHPRQRNFQRKLKQRGRPTGAGAEGGVPLKGAVTK